MFECIIFIVKFCLPMVSYFKFVLHLSDLLLIVEIVIETESFVACCLQSGVLSGWWRGLAVTRRSRST